MYLTNQNLRKKTFEKLIISIFKFNNAKSRLVFKIQYYKNTQQYNIAFYF